VGPEGIAAAAAVGAGRRLVPDGAGGVRLGRNRFVGPWRPPWPMPAPRCCARLGLSDVDDPAVAGRRETLGRLRLRLLQFARAPMFDQVGPMIGYRLPRRGAPAPGGLPGPGARLQAFLTSPRAGLAADAGGRSTCTTWRRCTSTGLVRAGAGDRGATGERPEIGFTAGDDGLSHGLKARFGARGTLTYNASRRGYSGVWLRPDYLWEPTTGGGSPSMRSSGWRGTTRRSTSTPRGAVDPVRRRGGHLVKMHAYGTRSRACGRRW